MRRMRSANSSAMPGRLAGPPQEHRVVVDAEQELAEPGMHAQVVHPRLELRGELAVVAAHGGGDALDGDVGRLALCEVRVDLDPRLGGDELERRLPGDGR